MVPADVTLVLCFPAADKQYLPNALERPKIRSTLRWARQDSGKHWVATAWSLQVTQSSKVTSADFNDQQPSVTARFTALIALAGNARTI